MVKINMRRRNMATPQADPRLKSTLVSSSKSEECTSTTSTITSLLQNSVGYVLETSRWRGASVPILAMQRTYLIRLNESIYRSSYYRYNIH
jgi:hypothetical protein